MLKRYFNWLQKDAPVGDVEKYPEINAAGETTVPGIYVAGDLTGIPLLKLAADSGAQTVRRISGDSRFRKARENKPGGLLDIVIIGAGPAGIAAGMEAKKQGLDVVILESAAPFNTIANFPKGKPIYAEPENYQQVSSMQIKEGKKETLLRELEDQLSGQDLPIRDNSNVDNVVNQKDHFEVVTEQETFKALRVLLATGKSGNSRQLKVPGENLEKVFNQLIDPMETRGRHVLVVGGGDSALETAIAVAEYAESVTLSYRKPRFSRPKEGNLEKLTQLHRQEKVNLLMESQVKEITAESAVLLDKDNKEITLPNSQVYVLIGKQLPLDFFSKINVKMQGVWSRMDKWMFAALLLFSGVMYFGKSGFQAVIGTGEPLTWGGMFGQLVNPAVWGKFLAAPFNGSFFQGVGPWNWTYALYGFVGWFCFVGFLITGIRVLAHVVVSIKNYTDTSWKTFKYTYFFLTAVFLAAKTLCTFSDPESASPLAALRDR